MLLMNSERFSLEYHCYTNHVHSGALTICLLPDIAPLPAGLFNTSTGLSWYHASIIWLPARLFSTPMGLLAFIELPCFKLLLSIDPLQAGLFSTPTGFPCIKILSIWKLIGTRACLSPAKHMIHKKIS